MVTLNYTHHNKKACVDVPDFGSVAVYLGIFVMKGPRKFIQLSVPNIEHTLLRENQHIQCGLKAK